MSIMRRNRKTKIVATLGPASSDVEMIRNLFKAGVDVFRMNFSHGDHADHKMRLDNVRKVEKEMGRPVGVFADMQGPKIRLGVFENEMIEVSIGQKIKFDSDPTPGNAKRVCLPHPEVIESLSVGEFILVDDGKVRLKVASKGDDFVEVEVIAGKKLMDRKGVNLPDSILTASVLTEKDRVDMAAALDMGVEWIAVSFVQRPEDIIEARKIIGDRAQIIAKIEKPSAVELFDEIVALTDVIMVARGDLGVEIPAEKVPSVQKRMIRSCRNAGVPVIVATQMLESMTESSYPTRAEVSDIATAIYDGADAVMLSAETASGDYPIEAVTVMDKVACDVEVDDLYKEIMNAKHQTPEHEPSDALTCSSAHVAKNISAAAIVNYTASGATTRRTSRERPEVQIFCLTEELATARRLQLSYAVDPVVAESVNNIEDVVKTACEKALEHDVAKAGDQLVVTAGASFGKKGGSQLLKEGSTNFLHIVTV